MVISSALLVLETLQLQDTKVSGTRHVRFVDGVRVSASADGQTFACWQTSVSPTGLQLLAVSGDRVHASYAHVSVDFAVPGCSGSRVYTGKGLYDRNLTVDRPTDIGQSFVLVPVPRESQWLHIGLDRGGEAVEEKPNVLLYRAGQEEPLASWNDVVVPEIDKKNVTGRATSNLTERVKLIPDSQVIATLPASNDRILLWPATE